MLVINRSAIVAFANHTQHSHLNTTSKHWCSKSGAIIQFTSLPLVISSMTWYVTSGLSAAFSTSELPHPTQPRCAVLMDELSKAFGKSWNLGSAQGSGTLVTKILSDTANTQVTVSSSTPSSPSMR